MHGGLAACLEPVITVLTPSAYVRRVVYTTNAIESIHAWVRVIAASIGFSEMHTSEKTSNVLQFPRNASGCCASMGMQMHFDGQRLCIPFPRLC